MVNAKRCFYTSVLVLALFVPVVGCGKPAPPPAGSPQDATSPTVDLGTESGAQEPGASSPEKTTDNGSPAGQEGDQK